MTAWKTPEQHPVLRPGEIHLWRIGLDGDATLVAEHAGLLSPDELARMLRFRFTEHRDRFALRRGALRLLLGRYLGVDPREVSFHYRPRGKPEIASHRPSGEHALRFNLSDSGDLALLAVGLDVAIGVDVEHLRPMRDMDALARRFFSEREYEDYGRLDAAAKAEGFYNCWTRKEAWLKARGDGLAWDLRGFDVTLVPGVAPALLRVQDAPAEPERWLLHADRPMPDFVSALATERSVWKVFHFAFGPYDDGTAVREIS